MQAANIDGDNDYEIYVIQDDGTVTVYSGDSMNVIGNYQTISTEADQCKIADLNNDGAPELIIVSKTTSSQYLHVYDAVDLTLEYQTNAYGGEDVEVGDIDGDGQVDIILSEGYVLNGSTYNLEWQYYGGFGNWIELGDANSDTIKDIIGANYNGQITAFDGTLHSPLWQFTNNYYENDALKVTYIDGTCEILVGVDEFTTAILSYDALTQQKLWECHGESSGVTNIGVGDPDNDGVKEFIWGSGSNSSGADYLNVGGFDYFQTEWKSEDLDGPYMVSAGDVNNDDTTEIVMASNETNSGYDQGEIIVYNGMTHSRMSSWVPGFSWDDIDFMKTANIDQTPQDEIIVAIDQYLFVYDGITNQLLWQSEALGYIKTFEVADVDNDNVMEIVVGNSSGNIFVINGETHEQEWQSIDTGNEIGDIEIANCDDDDNPEIVFCNYNGIIQIYDGVTHLLQWQSLNISDVITLDVCDYNRDGITEIAAGENNGDISFISCSDYSIIDSFQAFNTKVRGLKVGNFDSTARYEIIAGASSLKIFDINGFQLLWQSENIGTNVGAHDGIQLTDVDNNQYMDLLIGTDWGVFQFESTMRYPDITPPKITSTMPLEAMLNMGTNIPVQAQFSELMDQALFNDTTVTVVSQEGSQLPATLDYDTTTNRLTITPNQLLPANNTITVLFTASLADTAGNGLDGNNNGIAEGSPVDDYTLTFTTGSGADTVGPYFTQLDADSYSKWEGMTISVNGMLTDSSGFSYSPLVGAECFIDIIGNDGEGLPMSAADYKFDEITEEVTLKIATDNWTNGEHVLYFHGKDLAGNWGEFSQFSITIEVEQPGAWPMFGGNAIHTGYTPLDSIKPPLKVKWVKSMFNYKLKQACVVNDKIIFSGKASSSPWGSILVTADMETGDDIWYVLDSDGAEFMPPAFGYGYVYLQSCNGSGNSYMYAYNVNTGEMAWQAPYSAQWDTQLAPTVANGRLFFSAGMYGGVCSYDAFTGHNYWSYSLPQFDGWTPAYYNDTVYTFTGDYNNSYFAAINAWTGILAYDIDNIPFNWWGYTMNSAPAVDTSKRIIILTSRNYLSAIDMDTREDIWDNSGDFVNPAIYNSQVFSINNGDLKVYNIATGEFLWSYSESEDFEYPPVIVNGYVFVSSENHVYAVNLTSHNMEWSYPAGGYLTAAYNYLIVAGTDQNIYAFESETMDINEHDQTENPVLYQNYPNPVSGLSLTSIRYYLPETADVRIEIYNVNGLNINTLEYQSQTGGEHIANVKTNNMIPGIYFYKLYVDNSYVATKKMIISM